MPCLLNDILEIAQLTAFLTYNYWSNSKSFKAINASVCILFSPSGVDKSSPKNIVAYLLILTTLQWQYADAKPTNPNSIIFLFSVSSLAISFNVMSALAYLWGSKSSVSKISINFGNVRSKTAL